MSIEYGENPRRARNPKKLQKIIKNLLASAKGYSLFFRISGLKRPKTLPALAMKKSFKNMWFLFWFSKIILLTFILSRY